MFFFFPSLDENSLYVSNFNSHVRQLGMNTPAAHLPLKINVTSCPCGKKLTPHNEEYMYSTSSTLSTATYHNTQTGLGIFLPSQRGRMLLGLQAQVGVKNTVSLAKFQV